MASSLPPHASSRAPARRCAKHDLAVGPDGLCAVCKRAAGSVSVAPLQATEPARVDFTRVVLGVAALASVLGLGLVMLPESVLGVDPFGQQPVARATLEPLAPATRSPQPQRRVESTLPVDAGVAPLGVAVVASKPLEPNTAPAPSETPDEQLARLEHERAAAEQERVRHDAVKQKVTADQITMLRRNVTITMYSTSWCGHCARARAYMHEKDIAFTDYDIEQDADAHARAKLLNASGSVPIIQIDGLLMVGFGAEALEDRIDRAAKVRAGL
jgi:glutaredoxin